MPRRPRSLQRSRALRLSLYIGRRERLRVQRVLRMQSVGGVLVMLAAMVGFILANSPAREWFFALKDTRVGPAALHLDLTLGEWAADGLLAVFFFIVGLELKREFVEGVLSRFATAVVPVVAAMGGVVVPALIYLAVNAGRPSVHGWAIPTATDIAFAVAVLALIAPRIPLAMRVFLLTLAVVDDLIAIAIIAVGYSQGIRPVPLIGALALVGCYALLVRVGAGWYMRRPWAAWLTLLPVGVLVWALVHASGVHATVAGVLLAFAVPVASGSTALMRGRAPQGDRPAHRLAESFGRRFAPLSTAIAVPVFAFFAAGVSLEVGSQFWLDPIAIGIVLGLVLGKPIGIVLSTAVLVRFTGAELGQGVGLRDLIGVGALAGVGFTVSLLIAELSFADATDTDVARLSVMAASIISVLIAAILLRGGRIRPQNLASG